MTQFVLIILFVICSIMFLNTPQRGLSKQILFLFFCVLTLLITFRPESMADYPNYHNSFIKDDWGERLEPSFFIIKKIVHLCGDNALLGFFLYAIITSFTKYRYIIEKKELFWGMTLVYMSSTLISSDMVAMRAGVAGAFLLWMIKYKCEDETFKMIIAFFASVLFHYSAIILILIFFLNTQKGHRLFYILLLVGSYVLGINGLYLTQLVPSIPFVGDYTILIEMYSNELKQEESVMNIFNLVQLCRICICALFWLLINKITLYKKEFLLALKIYTVGICCLPLFANSTSLSVRLTELLFVAEILVIPLGFYTILKSTFMYRITVITFSSVLLMINLTNPDYWHP